MERGWFYENPRLGAPSGQRALRLPGAERGRAARRFLLARRAVHWRSVARDERFLRAHVSRDGCRDVFRCSGGLRWGQRSALVIARALHAPALPLHAAERCISSWRRTTSSRSARTSRCRCSTVGARIGLATGGLAALVALASGSFYYSAFTRPARRRRGRAAVLRVEGPAGVPPGGVRRRRDPGGLARPARADDRLPGGERDERRGGEALTGSRARTTA